VRILPVAHISKKMAGAPHLKQKWKRSLIPQKSPTHEYHSPTTNVIHPPTKGPSPTTNVILSEAKNLLLPPNRTTKTSGPPHHASEPRVGSVKATKRNKEPAIKSPAASLRSSVAHATTNRAQAYLTALTRSAFSRY
jgi:hypothetical protein